MTRRLTAALCLAALAFVWTAQADSVKIDPAKVKTTGGSDEKFDPEQLAAAQAQLKVEFMEFKHSLLRLAQNLELSNKPENKDKAAMLRQVLQSAADKTVDAKFAKLIEILRSPKVVNDLTELQKAEQINTELRRDLQTLLRILLSDDRSAQLRAERIRIEKMLEALKDVIRKQERVRAQTELGRKDTKEIAKDQNKVTGDTKDLIGKGKSGQGAEGKKGEAKPGGKEGGKDGQNGRGEGKKDTNQDKAPPKGEGKDGKPTDPKDGMGEPKDAKPGEGKQGEGKDGKGSEGKQGEPKDGKGSEGKPGQSKDGKGKDGEKAGKPKDGKGIRTKQEEKKNEAQPKDAKGGEGKQGDAKPGDGKPGEGKQGQPKDGQQPPKENKPSDSKGKGDQKASEKSDAKPGQQNQGQQAQGKPGQQGGQQGQQGQGKGEQGQQNQQQNQNQQPGEQTYVRKRIEEATKKQDSAEDNLKKPDRDKASENQDEAIKNLKDAQKRLEDLLRQLREEEIERLLAALQSRCEEMLRMQQQVYDGTVDVDGRVKLTPDKKPTREQAQRSNELSITEEEIVKMANVAIRLIEEEGSAIAFAEVFKQVRDDMDKVAKRLKKTDVGQVTQTIERDIIDTLKEMIAALKKARQDNKNKKPPKPGQPNNGKPPDQDLIDLLAELRMIRSMQARVYKRTTDYHKFYPDLEQAPKPETVKDAKQRDELETVQGELENLAERQLKIEKVTKDLSKGKNKTRD